VEPRFTSVSTTALDREGGRELAEVSSPDCRGRNVDNTPQVNSPGGSDQVCSDWPLIVAMASSTFQSHVQRMGLNVPRNGALERAPSVFGRPP
jgi:hypothetical protein